MKLILDRTEVDKAIKQAKEDQNLSEDFERTKVKIEDVKARILENLIGDEEEQENAIRDAIIDLYAS